MSNISIAQFLPLKPLGLVLLLGGASFACGTDAGDASADAEQDLSSSQHLTSMCSPAAPSEDGAYVVVDRCANSGGRGEVFRLSTGGRDSIGTYGRGDRLGLLGTQRGFAYYVTSHAGVAGWDVTVRDLALAKPARTFVPVFPAGTPASERLPPTDRDVTITPGGRHVIFTTKYGGKDVFVGDLTTGTTTPLALASSGYDEWPAPDGKRVLLHTIEASVHKTRVLHLDGSPTLGPELADPLDDLKSFADSFDGNAYLATGKAPGTSGVVLASIDTVTGAARVLSEVVETVSLVAARGAFVWYTAGRKDPLATPPTTSYVLERAPRDGSSPPLVLARSARSPIEANLSQDGTTVLFTASAANHPPAGYASEDDLRSVPADGSAPAARLRATFELQVAQQAGASLLVLERLPTVSHESMSSVINDITGARTLSWEGNIGLFDGTKPSALLSGDGTVVYKKRSCALATSGLSGTEVVRLPPMHGGSKPKIVWPCTPNRTISAPYLKRVPKSSMVIFERELERDFQAEHDHRVLGPVHTYEITLVKP